MDLKDPAGIARFIDCRGVIADCLFYDGQHFTMRDKAANRVVVPAAKIRALCYRAIEDNTGQPPSRRLVGDVIFHLKQIAYFEN